MLYLANTEMVIGMGYAEILVYSCKTIGHHSGT